MTYKQMNVDGSKSFNCEIKKAGNFFTRAKGLLFKADLQEAEGLLIKKCRSVHSFFMRFAIDLVFLDSKGEVLKTVCPMKPWSHSTCWNAKSVLELKSGSVKTMDIRIGQVITFD